MRSYTEVSLPLSIMMRITAKINKDTQTMMRLCCNLKKMNKKSARAKTRMLKIQIKIRSNFKFLK